MGSIDEGAEVAVNKCMKVQPEDKVLIVADTTSKDIGMAIRSKALALTEKVRFFNLDLPAYGGRPVKSMPSSLVDAIRQASVTFFLADAMEGELQTLREPFLKLAMQNARHAHMVGVNDRIMETGMCVDYDEVLRITNKVYDILSRTKEIHVTAPAGTDFKATFDPGLKWIPCSGVLDKRATWDNLPSGEVFTAPLTMEGRMVVDGSMGEWLGIKYFGKVDFQETPLDITVEHANGGSFLKSVKCKHKELLVDFKNYVRSEKCASRVGEIGIGTNIFLRDIIGNILQDEKFPTVHVAFGDPYDEKTGANWSCSYHIDLLMRECTIVADGREMMRDGVYTEEILS